MARFRHTAYVPVTEVGAGEPSFDAQSKFGGLPHLRDTADWPICPGCERRMTLFVQLNAGELPEPRFAGLMQFVSSRSRFDAP